MVQYWMRMFPGNGLERCLTLMELYNDDETKRLWGSAQTGTKTVIYNVTIPVGTASGNYPTIGTILATVSGETVGPSIVIGDGEVNVTGREATMIYVVAALRISASGRYTRMRISMTTVEAHPLTHS